MVSPDGRWQGQRLGIRLVVSLEAVPIWLDDFFLWLFDFS
jgi:hypothetical protein